MNEDTKRGFVYKPTPKKAWVHGKGKATARFGAASLMPNGHGWGKYLPAFEAQSRGNIESYACTVFGSLKAWITLANLLGLPLPKDASERFNAIMAGIVPPGANPHDVAESIRTWGMITQQDLPFDDSIHSTVDFYHPDPMEEGYVAEAKKVVQKVEMGHQYLWNDAPGARTPNKQQILKDALARGTECASVYAWNAPEDGIYYKNPGQEDEHWVMITDYVDGEYWIVDDQYVPFVKHLDWNFDFQTAEVYFLQRNSSGIAPNDRSYFQNLLRQMTEALTRLLAKLP